MRNPVVKILMGLSVIGFIVLAVQYETIARRSLTPAPMVCDFTKMANQSPAFVQHYLGPSIRHYGPRAKIYHGFDQPLEVCSYERQSGSATGRASVTIDIMFYRGKVAEMWAHFSEPLSPAEAARRTGLNLSAFQPDARSGYTEGDTSGSIAGYLVYSGTYKAVRYKQLKISVNSIARDGDTLKTAQQIGTGVYATLALATVSNAGKPAILYNE